MQERIATLLEAIKTGDEGLAHHFKKTEEWATVEEMIAAHDGMLYLLVLHVSYHWKVSLYRMNLLEGHYGSFDTSAFQKPTLFITGHLFVYI